MECLYPKSHSEVSGDWTPIPEPTCLLVPKKSWLRQGSQSGRLHSLYTSWASAHHVTLPVPGIPPSTVHYSS